jgi:hypothetical protein
MLIFARGIAMQNNRHGGDQSQQSDFASILQMIDYVMPEVEAIDPVAAYLLSVCRLVLAKNKSASEPPRPASMGRRGDAAKNKAAKQKPARRRRASPPGDLPLGANVVCDPLPMPMMRIPPVLGAPPPFNVAAG